MREKTTEETQAKTDILCYDDIVTEKIVWRRTNVANSKAGDEDGKTVQDNC